MKYSLCFYQVGEAAFYYPGCVKTSSSANHLSACCRDVPHISAEACSPPQQSGRSGWPNIRQRNSASRCSQGTPAGLASDEIDGAMQHAPHPGRQIIGAMLMQIGLSRMNKGCRFHFFPFFPVDRKTPKSGAKRHGFQST